MRKLAPTYYVRHPDETFSVANPQPAIVTNEAGAAFAQGSPATPIADRLFGFLFDNGCMGDHADVELSRSGFIDLVNRFMAAAQPERPAAAPQSAPGPRWIGVQESPTVGGEYLTYSHDGKHGWMMSQYWSEATQWRYASHLKYWRELPAPPGSVAPPEAERQQEGK